MPMLISMELRGRRLFSMYSHAARHHQGQLQKELRNQDHRFIGSPRQSVPTAALNAPCKRSAVHARSPISTSAERPPLVILRVYGSWLCRLGWLIVCTCSLLSLLPRWSASLPTTMLVL